MPGLLVLSDRPYGSSELRVVLDGLMVAGSLFVVQWVSVLRHVLDMADASRLAVGLSVA